MNLSRPPHSANPLSRNRPAGSGHHYHASADFDSSSPAYRASPLADVMSQTPLKHTSSNPDYEQMDKATEKWLADLEEYQSTLEEMATASLDANFKAEINSIEQWFQVLNEAEQTAALYTLLQHASPVQIRFLIAVLQQLARSDPLSAVLSPASFEKEAMQSRLNEALNLNQPSPTFNRSVGRTSAFSSVFGDRGNPESTDRSRLLSKNKSNLYSSGVFTPDRGPASASRSASLRASSGIRGGNDAVGSGGIHGSAAGILLSSRAAPASPWNNQFSATISRPRSADIGWRNPPLSPHINDTPSTNGVMASSSSSADNNVDHSFSLENPSSVWNNPVVGSKPENVASNFSGGLDSTDMMINATAYKLSALQTATSSPRSVGSPVVTIDPDVAKFRRAGLSSARKSAGGSNTAPNQSNSKQNSAISNSSQSQETVLLYNSTGQLVSVPRSQLVAAGSQIHTASPLVNNNRPASQHISSGASIDEEFPAQNHWQHQQSASSPQQSEFGDISRQHRLNNGSPSLRSQLGMASVNRHRRELSQGSLTNSPNSSRVNSPARSGTGERPRERSRPPAEDIIDLDLLSNISAWLRSLRLHKYTDVLKDMDWKDLVQLDDAGLEARGVNALGARRKMLKVFEKVKEAQTEGKLPR